jgi:dipeptidyl aminopeptidase/acylaminoacyl peptidase
MKRICIINCIGALVAFLASGALPGAEPARDHDIVPEDYFSLGYVNGVSVSPDGRFAAYGEARWEAPDEKQNHDLWLVELSSGEVRRLTFDKARDELPVWSADGRFVYFASNRERAGETRPPYDGKRQIWRVSPDGGEPRPVTRVDDGVNLFDLAADGTAVYYTVKSEETEDEWKQMREEHESLEYGHGVTEFSQVWRLDLRSWRAQKLVDEKRVIGAMHVAPDQSRIAMITTPDEELIHNEGWSRVDVYDAESKTVRVVTGESWRADHTSPFGWLNEVAWSGDGAALAFSVSFDGYPDRVYVAEWANDEARVHELRRPAGVTVQGGSLQWRGTSRDLCFIGQERARARVYALADVRGSKQGRAETLTPGDVTVDAFDFSSSGETHIVVNSTPTDLPDLYAVRDNGKLHRLTTVNPQIATWKLPQISIVSWKSEDGRLVEGILELPPDHGPEDGPLPMVVHLHGGPTAATKYRFRFRIYGRTSLAARGYALFSPNYRGSTGYGDEFMIELVGRENDIDVKDILSGVDAMVEAGIADPERLGVMGWSNGGFLTNCVITATDRFKAASSGAGVIDQVIQWGIEDTPGHVINFMQGSLPWADPDEYRSGSPLYHLDKVRTPTLVHVGQNDARVPAEHARTLYRGLRFYVNVPTELVVYPGEPHGLSVYEHREAKLAWDLAWFDRYILGKPPESDQTGSGGQ